MSEPIDDKTVSRIADLAKLEYTPEGLQEIKKDLNKVLGFIEKLSELDTSNVSPLIYMNEEYNILREDVVTHEISQQDALKNAPKKDSDYFKVPKVLDK